MRSTISALRDLVCLALGGWGFAWQVTHGAEAVLMLGSVLLLSGPSVMAWWALRGGTPDSGSSPSPPEPPVPSRSPRWSASSWHAEDDP